MSRTGKFGFIQITKCTSLSHKPSTLANLTHALQGVKCTSLSHKPSTLANLTHALQGVSCKISGKDVSQRFNEFLQRHYLTFCEHAIRCMFTCGFVPWRLRRIDTGDIVPEVLPLGTFTWSIEVNQRPSGRHKDKLTKTEYERTNKPESEHTNKHASKRINETAGTDSKRRKIEPDGLVHKQKYGSSAFYRQQMAVSMQPRSAEADASKTLCYKLQFVQALAFTEV